MSDRKDGFGAEKPGSSGCDQDPLFMQRLAEEIAEKAIRKARARHPDFSLTDGEAMAVGLILVEKLLRERLSEVFETVWNRQKEEEKKKKVVALAKVAVLALVGAEKAEEERRRQLGLAEKKT